MALGRVLFWDPIPLGQQGRRLCDRRHFEAGSAIPFVKRNSQTILNVAFNGIDEAGAYAPAAAPMFWDARARSLEQQALEPLKASRPES